MTETPPSTSSDREKSPMPENYLRRNVKDLMNCKMESPSHSDITWGQNTPVKGAENSGFRGRLTVGGKSKSLKSSNQLVLKTPKNTSSKKYHSSPIFLLARNQEDREETIKRNTENKKIFDEFVKQFGISENNDAENENEYVPRNLMDNLPDSHNDSIVSLQLPESPKKPKDTPDDFKISDYEYDLSDSENFDYLAELEEEAKKLLESTPQSSANTSKEVAAATTTNFAKQNEKEKEKTNQDSGKCSTNYFDSDEDEEAILASIPMEVFNDEHYLTKSVNKYAVNNNTGQKINLVEREQINKHRVNNSNLLEKPLAVNIAKPIGHSTVINTKQDTNCLINSNGLKQHNHTKIESKNSTSESKVINPPQAKKICSSDEIAEKKRQALQRREAYLESLRLTQKKPNVKL